jgi:hypothetical protein
MHANISFSPVGSGINSTFLETMILTSVEDVVKLENKTSTLVVNNTIRSGYIFSFVIVFLIVLIGIVSRVIYSSHEPPIGYVYKKYQRALSLPADYRCQIEFNDKTNEIAVDMKGKKESNKKKLEDVI